MLALLPQSDQIKDNINLANITKKAPINKKTNTAIKLDPNKTDNWSNQFWIKSINQRENKTSNQRTKKKITVVNNKAQSKVAKSIIIS